MNNIEHFPNVAALTKALGTTPVFRESVTLTFGPHGITYEGPRIPKRLTWYDVLMRDDEG